MSSNPDVVIVGAGPYGLSIAAHLRFYGVKFRIFGSPLSVWRSHMPEGMYLKSDGFASNLSDPESRFTLKEFCSQAGIPYHDTDLPVRLDTFVGYGDAFQKANVPALEDVAVTSITKSAGGFIVKLETGEEVETRKVVLAVGISHFAYIPPVLEGLPPELVSHSCAHSNVERFRGKDVTVVGGGASAMDLAALLRDSGANVTVIARAPAIVFNSPPAPRSRWQHIRHPNSGVGPSLHGWFYCNYPNVFRCFPERLRKRIVQRFLGPAAGWTVKERVAGRVPMILGSKIAQVVIRNGGLCLHLTEGGDKVREHTTEHVIAATGYKVNLKRLRFLNEQIRSKLVTDGISPVLSRNFESSVPGLYFVGLAAANTFGPLLRFAFGADFASRTVSRHLTALLQGKSIRAPRPAKALDNAAEYE